MAEARQAAVFTIPPHRGFADALVAGILADVGGDRIALARGTILLPNNRAGQAVQDAFVRQAAGGLLLPRLVAVGDPDLGERTGALLDPIGAEDIPPAVDPLQRQFILARLIREEGATLGATDMAEAMRLAGELGRVLDQLTVEQKTAADLRNIDVGELSHHWQAALAHLSVILIRWPEELKRLGRIDLAERRNRQLAIVAERWRNVPTKDFTIAAGISTTAPAIAELLRVIAFLPQGKVVLAGLDRDMPEGEWQAIAGDEDEVGIETHPQFHLAQLLGRMGVARGEVGEWHPATPPRAARSIALAHAMAPPAFTRKWADLAPAERSLKGVHALELANMAEEAQTIALALREAVETPGRTAALVTPDRDLATRVSALLARWGIEADDSAGRALSALPPGTLLLALATAAVEGFAPVPLLALLKHPLVRSGSEAVRLEWLDKVRALDLALRGPRPASGLAGVGAYLADGGDRERKVREPAAEIWGEIAALLAPVEASFANRNAPLADLMATLRAGVVTLAGEAAWAGRDGRMLADLVAAIEEQAAHGPAEAGTASMPMLLRQLLDGESVRPAQGGHPRIAIWGLIEARLQSADLTILGGLNEGTWPALAAPDPWLAPAIRRQLGLPSLERRIGLAAHDLVAALGSGDALLTRAKRDARAPAIPSRFWLRLETLAEVLDAPPLRHDLLARALDHAVGERAKQPAPCPPADERPRTISVTEVDVLKADPYTFYAKRVLRLTALGAPGEEPDAKWRGTFLHAVFGDWGQKDGFAQGKLLPRLVQAFDESGLHPVVRALWQPRFEEAAASFEAFVEAGRAEGRAPFKAEIGGSFTFGEIKLTGRADRIDTLPGGKLGIVDYKTGQPPSDRQVKEGFALQLGLIGLLAECGGFPGIEAGEGKAAVFEYWSQGRRSGKPYGYVASPTVGKGANKIPAEEFVADMHREFEQAVENWLTGDAPFTAKLRPEYAWSEFDQLMRYEEWQGRSG